MSDQSASTAMTADANASLFPYRLYEMLEECERHSQTDIVSWLPDGKSFKVHLVPIFVETILPKYFRQTKYKSYQRQLNLWGFERITSNGPEKGGYYHTNFLKGRHDMVKLLTRQRGNKTDGQAQPAIKISKAKSSTKNPKRAITTKTPNANSPTYLPPSQTNSIVTPPVSPRDFGIPQTIETTIQAQPTAVEYRETIDLLDETPYFEGCEFFLLDDDAKYNELADVLLETGFMILPGNKTETTGPANYTLPPGPPSQLCV